MITIERVYDSKSRRGVKRFLVDRLWPRGIRKETLKSVPWIKDAGPSTELRKWFNHEVDKWPEFRKRYRQELRALDVELEPIIVAARSGDVILLYSARDTEHNQAVVLKSFLDAQLKKKG